jgi:hypothetical protein
MYAVQPCLCGPPYQIVAVIAVNGVRQYRVGCAKCGETFGSAIPHRKLSQQMMLEAPVVVSRVEFACPCERCGGTDGTELHHWAPSSVFPDFYRWPTSSLCVHCHQHWHRVMAAYAMPADVDAP